MCFLLRYHAWVGKHTDIPACAGRMIGTGCNWLNRCFTMDHHDVGPCGFCLLCECGYLGRWHVGNLDAAEQPYSEQTCGFPHKGQGRKHRFRVGCIDMISDRNGCIPGNCHPPDEFNGEHLAIGKDRMRVQVVQAAHFRTSSFWATLRISAPFLSVHSAMTRPSCRVQWDGWWCSSTRHGMPDFLSARSISITTGPFTPRLRGTRLPSARV